MKKIGAFFGKLFGVLLGMVLLLILGVAFIGVLPFDYLIYKRSLYYKTYRKKYKLLAATGMEFKLMNEILKHEFPITFVENPKEEGLENGCFIWKDTLLILGDFNFEYHPKTGGWHYAYYEEDGDKKILLTLDEYLEESITDANALTGKTICHTAVVLQDASQLDEEDLARQDPRFLVYDTDRVQVLKEFCREEGL